MLNICLPPAHQSTFPIFILLISLACCPGDYFIVKRSTTLVRGATTSRQIRSTESTAPAFYRSYQYLADPPRVAARFWQPALEQFGTWLNAVLIILFTHRLTKTGKTLAKTCKNTLCAPSNSMHVQSYLFEEYKFHHGFVDLCCWFPDHTLVDEQKLIGPYIQVPGFPGVVCSYRQPLNLMFASNPISSSTNLGKLHLVILKI